MGHVNILRETPDDDVNDGLITSYFMYLGRCIVSNPVLRVISFAVIVTVLTPVLLFLIFTIINATFAFMGFMLLQVSVLAVGLSILGCIVFCTVMSLGIIGVSIFCVYYVVRYTSQFFDCIIFEQV